jgi:hypothetical protein
MYRSQAETGGGGDDGGAQGGGPADENVVDADFEEVDDESKKKSA